MGHQVELGEGEGAMSREGVYEGGSGNVERAAANVWGEGLGVYKAKEGLLEEVSDSR